MILQLQLLSNDELRQLHTASLEVLRKTGMRLDSPRMLEALRRMGATVDTSAGTVRYPERLVEEALAGNLALIRQGRKLHLLNGVTSEHGEGPGIAAKLSGGCEKYLDWETLSLREADAEGLLRFIRLGELLPEVAFVGNPIVPRRDLEGRPIEERLRRIRTAALVAKHTRKLGSMEVWSVQELDFLVELGTIARGGPEEYRRRPCFLTAKETISPLHLDDNSAEILLALAERGLPCTIIPMPLSGLSAPVTRLGNAVLGNAEILGVLAAVRAVCPEALVGGGTISGVLDMASGAVSFSSPEAILQDIAVAEVHERLYGLDYLIGSGYTDARVPGSQVLAEKLLKYLLTFLTGRHSYPLGLVNAGAVFSDVQALVDLELCRYIHAHFESFGDFSRLPELTALIDAVGIRGNYLGEGHTLAHFRENWLPELFERSASLSSEDNRRKDLYAGAWQRLRGLYARKDFWQLDADACREIDAVVTRAEKVL
jgi:trimethylamine--corrinoid protein Co-methyltransferase